MCFNIRDDTTALVAALRKRPTTSRFLSDFKLLTTLKYHGLILLLEALHSPVNTDGFNVKHSGLEFQLLYESAFFKHLAPKTASSGLSLGGNLAINHCN